MCILVRHTVRAKRGRTSSVSFSPRLVGMSITSIQKNPFAQEVKVERNVIVQVSCIIAWRSVSNEYLYLFSAIQHRRLTKAVRIVLLKGVYHIIDLSFWVEHDYQRDILALSFTRTKRKSTRQTPSHAY